MKKILYIFTFLLILLLNTISTIQAQGKGSVTIVNPIRGSQLGLENRDLLQSLKGQWNATKEATISATWLWQYSALEETNLVNFARKEMQQNQEHGIFLEIDKNTAEKSGVEYKGKTAWYYSDGIFLTSYDIFERKKLIDTVFAKFHTTFGYYPTSVGAWWVGAESIQYMKEKYGIIAVLQCADQFATDAYSIWGTPWSIPYLPDKNNAAIPAQDYQSSSKVVITQWAPRDPLRAYGKSVEQSTFSLQDYRLKNYNSNYFNYLKNIYLKDETDNITFGLESGLPPDAYYSQYKEQLHEIDSQKATVKTMKQYANDFLNRKKVFSKTTYFLTKDYENNNQSFWYNSENFRLNIQKIDNEIFLSDIRNYTKKNREDFFTLPNTQPLLRINTQSTIDSIKFPEQKIKIAETESALTIENDKNKIILKNEKNKIAEINNDGIKILTQNSDAFKKINTNIVKIERGFNITFSQEKGSETGYYHTAIFLIIISLFIAIIKNKKDITLAIIFLIIFTLINFNTITSGINKNGEIFFTNNSVNAVKLIPSVKDIQLEVSLLLIYQILPLAVITTIIIILIITSMTIASRIFLFSIVSLTYIFYQTNSFSIETNSLTQSKRALLSSIAVLYLFVGVLTTQLFLIKHKQQFISIIISTLTLASIFCANYQSLFQEKRVILTSFEIEVIQYIKNSEKEIVLFTPSGELNYRAIKPIAYSHPQLVSKLTNKNIQVVYKSKNITENLSNIHNKNIVVPRFLEVEIYEEEITKHKLTKIFDNAQIAIYTQI